MHVLVKDLGKACLGKGWLGSTCHSDISKISILGQKHLYLPYLTLFFIAALSEASEKLTLL